MDQGYMDRNRGRKGGSRRHPFAVREKIIVKVLGDLGEDSTYGSIERSIPGTVGHFGHRMTLLDDLWVLEHQRGLVKSFYIPDDNKRVHRLTEEGEDVYYTLDSDYEIIPYNEPEEDEE